MLLLYKFMVGENRISYFKLGKSATAIMEEDGERIITEQSTNAKILLKDMIIIIQMIILMLIIKFISIIANVDNTHTIQALYLIPCISYFAWIILVIIYVRTKCNVEARKNLAAANIVFKTFIAGNEEVPETESDLNMKFSNCTKPNCKLKCTLSTKICRKTEINIFSAMVITQLIGFILFHFMKIAVPEILLIIIGALLKDCFPFNALGLITQIFLTEEPDDLNLKLAIDALTALKEQ